MKTWTPQEVELLKVNYNSMPNIELQKLLPNKSPLAIYKKAYKLGFRKDSSIEFLNRSLANKGENNYKWRGGRAHRAKGYIGVKCPEHPRADHNGYVMEHILVFERAMGISVTPDLCVHHINHKKDDNRIENLCLMTKAAHTKLHHIGAKRSEETKTNISKWAKERLKNKENHPRYKNIDMVQLQAMIDSGMTVKEACSIAGINKTTYYKKKRG